MAVDIDSLQIEIEATSSDAASKIEQLATALTNLKSAAKGGAGLTTVSKQLQALSNATKTLNSTNINTSKLKELTSALNSLSSVQKVSGLTSSINALKKLPDITSQLGKMDLGKFASQMREVASAMAPLANEMQKVANGFSAFPVRIQKIIQSNSSLAQSNKKTAKTFSLLNTGINLYVFQRFASIASDWVTESNAYVENLNLFTVAMGEYASEAKEYAEQVQSIMGIDSSEWMRNQGVFMQMASGFGVATDSAALMSKNLTQLGYDISSFYNIGIEEAMEKLQSGLAGEIEPLRRLGYAIDVASLEQVALNHGITESVNAMTQAEKAQLRYVAIMEQSKNAMGDLSRTIQTPANAMRILNQQITQLSRALGNLLIPILQQIIPWVQAFVEVLTEAIQALASLFGFELPTIDYSGIETGIGGVTSGAEDASGALGDAAKKAKELNNAVLGIDELNIISPKQDTGGTGGSGGGAAGGGDLGLDLPEYDFLGGLRDQVNSLKEPLKEFLIDYVLPIGTALAGWKILDFIDGLGAANGLVKDLKKALVGGIVAYLEFQLVKGSFDDFLSEGGDIWDLIKGALYAAIGSGILYMMFGKAGLVVGLGVALVATLTSLATAIGNGLDYNGLKANIMKVIAMGLGGAIGFVLGGITGAGIGILVTAGITLTITSIMANKSGQVTSGSLENAINIILAGLVSGLAGAGIGLVLGGPAGALIGFVIGATISISIQGISMNWDEVKNWASGLFGDVIAEIEAIWNDPSLNILAKFTGIGIAIVNGILTGILEAISGIGQWLWNNLVAPIINAVKDFLGIHSPSTVFQEIGRNIIDGLLLGIQETWNNIIGFFTEALPAWWNETIVPWFTLEKWQELVSSIKDSIIGVWNDTVGEWATSIANWWNTNVAPWFTLERWSGIASNISTSIGNAWNNTVGAWAYGISSWWSNNVVPWFTLERWSGIASNITTSISGAWDSTVGQWGRNISDWWNNDVKPWFTLDKWKELGNSALEGLFGGLSAIGDKISTWGGNLIAGVKNFFGIHSPSTLFRDEIGYNLGEGIAQGLMDATSSVMAAAQSIVTSVQKVFNGVAYDPSVNYMEQINEAVASGDLERAAELETIRNAKIDGEGLDWSKTFDFSGLTGGFETVAEEYSTYVGNMSTVSQEFGLSSRNEIEVTLNSFSDALKEAGDNNEKFCNETMTMYKNMAARSNASIQSIISYLNSIPRNITTVHTIITQSVSGGSSKTKSFATGGFPDEGQMFIARESGPELVGSIGRRTAVANNSQIVESVAKGVYDAVLAAMQNGQEQGNDRPIDLKVYLDGKQIRASVKQADRQAGASIMTGGVTNR